MQIAPEPPTGARVTPAFGKNTANKRCPSLVWSREGQNLSIETDQRFIFVRRMDFLRLGFIHTIHNMLGVLLHRLTGRLRAGVCTCSFGRLFLNLGAEVEGDHHREYRHKVFAADSAAQRQDAEHQSQRQGDDGFHLQLVGAFLFKVSIFFPS